MIRDLLLKARAEGRELSDVLAEALAEALMSDTHNEIHVHWPEFQAILETYIKRYNDGAHL